jgi:hypothetical protein
MIDAFDRHWPTEIELLVYAEHCSPKSPSARVKILNLVDQCPDLVRFKNKHVNNPLANGTTPKILAKNLKDNRFKWDAVRFSHKVFAVIHACQNIDADWIIWLDADTVTFAPISLEFLSSICDAQSMACYLGRDIKYHSECGWVAYNKHHPDLQEFMIRWRDLYATDNLFCLDEYHDSFVFDVLRKDFQAQRHTKFHNLSPALPKKGPGHPFIASALGLYMDHMKGSKRKELGHSLPDDYDRNQGLNSTVPYWQGIFGNR